jgi:hypothetical protein
VEEAWRGTHASSAFVRNGNLLERFPAKILGVWKFSELLSITPVNDSYLTDSEGFGLVLSSEGEGPSGVAECGGPFDLPV